jgi:hypothetical protein
VSPDSIVAQVHSCLSGWSRTERANRTPSFGEPGEPRRLGTQEGLRAGELGPDRAVDRACAWTSDDLATLGGKLAESGRHKPRYSLRLVPC